VRKCRKSRLRRCLGNSWPPERRRIPDARLFQLCPQTQAGIAQSVIQLNLRKFVGRVKNRHVECHLAGDALFNHVKGHGLGEIQARWKNIDALGAVGAFPQGVAGVKPDLAVLIIAQVAPAFWDLGARLIGVRAWSVNVSGPKGCPSGSRRSPGSCAHAVVGRAAIAARNFSTSRRIMIWPSRAMVGI
jgi:hypothetical protein